MVPEKVHTHPMEGHWKYPWEGVLKPKILEAKYEAKLEFPSGRGGAKQKTFHGGSMDIFLKCTLIFPVANLITSHKGSSTEALSSSY